MPELPEVQTVVSELAVLIVGKEITEIEEYYPNTLRIRCETEAYCSLVTEVSRRGKYILIHLANNHYIIVHLRMTGKLIYAETEGDLLKHERARIYFTDGTYLRFDDVRTFGTIDCLPEADLAQYFFKLGVEPLSEDFNYKYIKENIAKITSPIKSYLLDQNRIAGLGNIYVCEVLYRTGIHPLTKANEVKPKQLKLLVTEIKAVLAEAIECNGTTISDYRRVDDKTGSFQNFLQVYGKDYCPEGHELGKVKIGGRSTYFCPICQK
ncbi:MAG: DNA-formamidopyrimidine glycosylase [Candidatus Cloacimonadales bacterium]